MRHPTLLASSLALSSFALVTTLAHTARADVVTEWNRVALDTQAIAAVAANPAPRDLAIAHLAGFDAVNAIEPIYEPYQEGLTAALPADPTSTGTSR